MGKTWKMDGKTWKIYGKFVGGNEENLGNDSRKIGK